VYPITVALVEFLPPSHVLTRVVHRAQHLNATQQLPLDLERSCGVLAGGACARRIRQLTDTANETDQGSSRARPTSVASLFHAIFASVTKRSVIRFLILDNPRARTAVRSAFHSLTSAISDQTARTLRLRCGSSLALTIRQQILHSLASESPDYDDDAWAACAAAASNDDLSATSANTFDDG
jgi:hypothetical protein